MLLDSIKLLAVIALIILVMNGLIAFAEWLFSLNMLLSMIVIGGSIGCLIAVAVELAVRSWESR